MNRFPSRRRLLAAGLSLAALAASRPAVAALAPTPRQTAGPFYPAAIPLDSDADLVTVVGRAERAAGTVAHIFGRVLDPDGRPVAGARVEIWQCDAFGRYHHPRDPRGPADPNFQGFGRATAGADGGYRFRTIEPVPYPGRTPHIHFAIFVAGGPPFVTQMYLAGHKLNDGDGVLARVTDAAARARLMIELRPAPDLEPGALGGNFDIVLDRAALGG